MDETGIYGHTIQSVASYVTSALFAFAFASVASPAPLPSIPFRLIQSFICQFSLGPTPTLASGVVIEGRRKGRLEFIKPRDRRPFAATPSAARSLNLLKPARQSLLNCLPRRAHLAAWLAGTLLASVAKCRTTS